MYKRVSVCQRVGESKMEKVNWVSVSMCVSERCGCYLLTRFECDWLNRIPFRISFCHFYFLPPDDWNRTTAHKTQTLLPVWQHSCIYECICVHVCVHVCAGAAAGWWVGCSLPSVLSAIRDASTPLLPEPFTAITKDSQKQDVVQAGAAIAWRWVTNSVPALCKPARSSCVVIWSHI